MPFASSCRRQAAAAAALDARERDDTRGQLEAFRRLCRADNGPLAGAEARALHSTLDVAARQAALQKTLTVRGALRAQVTPCLAPCLAHCLAPNLNHVRPLSGPHQTAV